MKKYIPLINNKQYIFISKEDRNNILEESLRLSDLSKHAGISDFTAKWKKDRLKFKGGGQKSSKLIELHVNKKEDYISFIFLSEPTYKFNIKVTKLPDMELIPDTLYTEEIRFLNFFSLLQTNPNFTIFKDVSTNNIKEVLKNCDVLVWCDCPSMWYQGDAWVLTQFDASLHPCNIKPKRWNLIHNDYNLICKHLSLIIAQQAFYINNMSSMIYKYLQK